MRHIKKHRWIFPARFRTGAYRWNGSKLAIHRLREAVSEIKKIAKKDPLLGAEGAVRLMEKIWSARHIDTSSGALGSAVYKTLHALIPVIVKAPADNETRDQWLDRLWRRMVSTTSVRVVIVVVGRLVCRVCWSRVGIRSCWSFWNWTTRPCGITATMVSRRFWPRTRRRKPFSMLRGDPDLVRFA